MKILAIVLYKTALPSLPAITEQMTSPPPIRQREGYSLLYNKRFASANWPSQLVNIIHLTTLLAPSFVPTKVGQGCVLPWLSLR